MKNNKENITRLLHAMAEKKRRVAESLSGDRMSFRRTLRLEASQLEAVAFLFEDKSLFDECVKIYLKEEDQNNG